MRNIIHQSQLQVVTPSYTPGEKNTLLTETCASDVHICCNYERVKNIFCGLKSLEFPFETKILCILVKSRVMYVMLYKFVFLCQIKEVRGVFLLFYFVEKNLFSLICVLLFLFVLFLFHFLFLFFY